MNVDQDALEGVERLVSEPVLDLDEFQLFHERDAPNRFSSDETLVLVRLLRERGGLDSDSLAAAETCTACQ